MKRCALAISLCLVLVLLLGACGNPSDTVVDQPIPASEPEAFGDADIASVPLEAADTLDEESNFVQEKVGSTSEMQENEASAEKYMEAAISAVIYAEVMDFLPYDSQDPVYFYRALGYLVDLLGENGRDISLQNGHGVLPETALGQYARAVFADYDGVPPALTEEDPLFSSDGAGNYLVNMLELGKVELLMQSLPAPGNGTQTIEVSLLLDMGTYDYMVELSENPEAGMFPYRIAAIHPVN